MTLHPYLASAPERPRLKPSENSPAPTTTRGTLTVNDGTHVSNITLLGQYMASNFVIASDGHGGTLITDPAPSPPTLLTQPQHA